MNPCSDKTTVSDLLLPLIVACALFMGGCNDATSTGGDVDRNASVSRSDARLESPESLSDLDLGGDFMETARSERGQPAGPQRSWAIIIQTFSGDGHEASAERARSQLGRVDALLTNGRVHTTPRGSMVVYGQYAGPEEAAAQRDLERIKSITYGGRIAFPRAYLSRLTTARRTFHEHELLSVREQHPEATIYTLDVAVWSDFDSGTMTVAEVRRSAEAYCRELRAQNVPAFYHHDDDRVMSTVTIGLFDHRAVDIESGIFSPEVEMLRRRFPARLVNGEPLMVPTNPADPNGPKRAQRPVLVEVPFL